MGVAAVGAGDGRHDFRVGVPTLPSWPDPPAPPPRAPRPPGRGARHFPGAAGVVWFGGLHGLSPLRPAPGWWCPGRFPLSV